MKKLVTVATVLGAAAPLLLASPALASVDSTLDQLAALRQAAISMPSAVEHPVLKDVLAQATAKDIKNDAIDVEYGQAYSMYTMTYTMRT